MERQVITRRNILLLGLGLFIVLIISIFINHSFLTINTSGVEAEVTIVKSSDSEGKKQTINGKKILFVPTGQYSIVTKKKGTNLATTYYRNIKAFGLTSVNVDFEKQKKVTNLGDSELGCVLYDGPTNQIVYKQCADQAYKKNDYLFTQDGKSLTEVTRIISDLPASEYRSAPYMGGILDSTFSQNKWRISKLTTQAGGFKESVSSYSLTENPLGVFSNPYDQASASFGVIAKDKRLLVFKDTSDSKPKEVDLSKYINDDPGYSVKGSVISGHLVIFNGVLASSVLGDAEDSTEGQKKTQQKIIDINLVNSQVTVTNLPADIIVGDISTNSSLETAIGYSSPDGKGHKVLFEKDGNLSSSPLIGDFSGSHLCWRKDHLYLLTDSGLVVSYSQKDNFASVVYANGGSVLSGLSCVGDNVYFSSNAADSSDDTSVRHFIIDFAADLAEKPEKNRPEDVLPILGDEKNNIASADYFKNRVTVLYRDFNDKSFSHPCTISSAEKSQVLNYFKNTGVDFSGFSFDVSYDCHSATQ